MPTSAEQQLESIIENYYGLSLDELLQQPAALLHEALEVVAGARRRPLRTTLLQKITDAFEGSPERVSRYDVDVLHNIVIEAARLTDLRTQVRLLEICTRAHPQSVELLCDYLNHLTFHSSDLAKMAEIWDRLNSAPKREYFWRYWCFGASYFAIVRPLPTVADCFATAQSLLEEGLAQVGTNQRSQLVTTAEQVLLLYCPEPKYEVVDALARRALQLGCQRAWQVALVLARLSRAQAVAGPRSGGRGEAGELELRVAQHLADANRWFALAETLFVPDPQHHIRDLYRERIHVLIAQREFGTAITCFRAILGQAVRAGTIEALLTDDPNLLQQLIFTCQQVGEPDLWRRLIDNEAVGTTDPAAVAKRLDDTEARVANVERGLGSIVEMIRSAGSGH